MRLDLRATEPAECGALAEFLSSTFHVSPQVPFLNPRLMDWKYFQPRPDWRTPRSWLLKEGSRIVAHAAIWPFHFALKGTVIDSMHVIDWAASHDAPGAGVLLFREVVSRTRTQLCLGGSDQARRVFPRLGLSQIGHLELHVRPTRPLHRFRLRRDGTLWKESARLVRNVLWARHSPPPEARLWTAQPVESFPESLGRLLASPVARQATRAERSVALLNYMLDCPFSSRAFLLHARGELRGYLLTTRLSGQTRIADLWIASTAELDWTAAYAAAVRVVATDPESCELVGASYCPFVRRALAGNGFRLCVTKPVWLGDPQSLFPKPLPLQIQALESDCFYLFNPDYPVFT